MTFQPDHSYDDDEFESEEFIIDEDELSEGFDTAFDLDDEDEIIDDEDEEDTDFSIETDDDDEQL